MPTKTEMKYLKENQKLIDTYIKRSGKSEEEIWEEMQHKDMYGGHKSVKRKSVKRKSVKRKSVKRK